MVQVLHGCKEIWNQLVQLLAWSWWSLAGEICQGICNVCCCLVTQLCLTLCNPMDCSMPDFPVLHHLLELAQTHIHSVSDAIQPSHPLSSPSPSASIFPSIRVFSNELALCIRWAKYWSFSFSISPSNEYSGFISFRIDWFDLLAVQGTPNTTAQKHQFCQLPWSCVS